MTGKGFCVQRRRRICAILDAPYMRTSDYYVLKVIAVAVAAVFLKYFLVDFVGSEFSTTVRFFAVVAVLAIGIGFVIRHVVSIIEGTTEVLQHRTGLSGGLLQSFGTALPDMIIGIVAALMSVQLASSDYVRSINLAIVAAAATFGSNIYNIFHAVWCLFRQNLANRTRRALLMFPGFPSGGIVTPMAKHKFKPSALEFTTAIRVMLALSLLTMAVAVSMVLFGRVEVPPEGFREDLYRLIRPAALVIAFLCLAVLYSFRKNHRQDIPFGEVLKEERYYAKQSTLRIWFDLAISGIAIFFAAEAMVAAIEAFASLTHTPYIVAGVLAGIIGCLSEMAVIHQFVVNPKGRVGDAIVGVAMDNILTTLGAAAVAVLGGIFLGGAALIMIFVIILTGNILLIAQIAELRESLARPSARS